METTSHNLDTFKLLFIIKGILTLFFSVFPIFYIFLGSFIFFQEGSMDNSPEIAGTIMVGIGIVIFLILLVAGILTILAGSYLGSRKNYNFIFAVAVLNCFTGILGILLGIFTIIELSKPYVKQIFGKTA